MNKAERRRMNDHGTTLVPVRQRGGYRQSALVLGTAQLGGAYGIANRTGVPDDDATARILTTAGELGVTHLDTARVYGDSERRLGARPFDLAVVTKVAPLDPAVAGDPGRVTAAVRASVDASRAALRRTGPLTLLLHRAADAVAAGGAGWRELRRRLAAGEADRIGVSVQSPAELRGVLDLPDLGYVQLPCNILDRRWPGVDLAGQPDLVITVRSAYLQGLLVAGTRVRWPHLSDDRRDAVLAVLDRLAAELGRDGRADLCLAYLLSLPWVTSVVVGAETEAQLRRNADLVRRPPLTAAERDRVEAALPEMPADLLDPGRWSA
jgi:aryl-alcohol dehydrogenase-like predicted oxidoreductase